MARFELDWDGCLVFSAIAIKHLSLSFFVQNAAHTNEMQCCGDTNYELRACQEETKATNKKCNGTRNREI